MDMVLNPAIVPFRFIFLDIIIATPTFDLQLKILKKVFHRLLLTY